MSALIEPRDLERLKRRVLDRIEELTHTAAPSDGDLGSGQQADDEAATLDLTINAIVGEQLRAGARRELRSLTGQLAWLSSDDVGLCQHCHQPIPIARLEAVPGTRLCIHCAANQGVTKP